MFEELIYHFDDKKQKEMDAQEILEAKEAELQAPKEKAPQKK